MKIHEPEIVTDNIIGGYYVRCKECGKVLWYPLDDDPCKPPPPTLGVNVLDRVQAKDKFGNR